MLLGQGTNMLRPRAGQSTNTLGYACGQKHMQNVNLKIHPCWDRGLFLSCCLFKSVLLALLQKLVGDFFLGGREIWRELCGNLPGVFLTHEIKAQKFWG